MRRLISFFLVLGLLLGSALAASGTLAQSPSPSGYLPDILPLEHAACFRIDGDGTLDFPALIDRFAGVPDAAAQLEALGWADGAYRQFGCDAPPAGRAGWIDISVHRFGDPSSAAAAVPFFADARALGTALQAAPAASLGESSAALTGPASNGTDYTLYASQGPLLFRVTGVAPVGSPEADVEQVMAGLVLGSEVVALHQERIQEAPMPAPTVPPSYPTSTDPAFVILDLGTGHGNASIARDINQRGKVLWAWGTPIYPMAEVWSDGRTVISWNGMTTDLTSLGMDRAVAINDLGMVLGGDRDRGLLYWPDSGTVEPIPGFEDNGYPAAINDFGIVTGNVDGRAVIADGSRLIEIPLPPDHEYFDPAAINNAGDVAGWVSPDPMDSRPMRAALYVDGVVEILDAAPGAAGSSADDLNDAGQLVGSPGVGGMHRVHGAGRAFLYDSGTGTTTDIGTLPGYGNSYAAAINNAGQVVGSAWVPDNEADPDRRAFLYDHRTGVISDLNDLIPQGTGWNLMDAFAISNAGQIVGQGLIGGEMHGFVLTPSR